MQRRQCTYSLGICFQRGTLLANDSVSKSPYDDCGRTKVCNNRIQRTCVTKLERQCLQPFPVKVKQLTKILKFAVQCKTLYLKDVILNKCKGKNQTLSSSSNKALTCQNRTVWKSEEK